MPDMLESKLPLKWEKMKVISGVIASILVPVAIAMAGHFYSKATKEKEIGIRYVEIAIQLLQTKPEKQTAELRKWAIDIIDHYSEVHLPLPAIDELKSRQLELKYELRRINFESAATRRDIDKLQGEDILKRFEETLRSDDLSPGASSSKAAGKKHGTP